VTMVLPEPPLNAVTVMRGCVMDIFLKFADNPGNPDSRSRWFIWLFLLTI